MCEVGYVRFDQSSRGVAWVWRVGFSFFIHKQREPSSVFLSSLPFLKGRKCPDSEDDQDQTGGQTDHRHTG